MKQVFKLSVFNLFAQDCDCLASQAQLAAILLRREGPDYLAKDGKQLTKRGSFLI